MDYVGTGLFVLISVIVFIAVIMIFDLIVVIRKGVTISEWMNWLGKTAPVVPFILGLIIGLSGGHFYWPIYQTQPMESTPPGVPSEAEELAEAADLYPLVPISAISHWDRPRATIRGEVTYVCHEADGDWHFQVTDLNDSKLFVTCEIIPELMMDHPKVRDTVEVRGVVRHDGKHNWDELHPVTHWQKYGK